MDDVIKQIEELAITVEILDSIMKQQLEVIKSLQYRVARLEERANASNRYGP